MPIYPKLPILLLAIASTVMALDNGAALLPPLIVSTESLGCDINQVNMRQLMDQIISMGLDKAGFRYVLIADCWQGVRDQSSGRIAEDKSLFPSGLDKLISYAHDRNLMVGLGTDIGPTTSQNRSGSLNYQQLDALTYAQWKIDLVQLANSNRLAAYRQRFTIMSEFVQKSGKTMVISIDLKNADQAKWARGVANIWTTARKRVIDWQTMKDGLIDLVGSEGYAGVGAWSDPGALASSLSNNQFLVQLGLWIGLKAPLQLMAPLSDLSTLKLSYFLNNQLISINQDPLRKSARLIRHDEFQLGFQQIWGGWLSSDRYVLFFLNGLSSASSISLSLTQEAKIDQVSSYSLRDPVTRTNLGSSSSSELTVMNIPSHGLEIRILHL